MATAADKRQQLFEELKNHILVKYELDTPDKETGSVREDILQDREERKDLFEDPEVNEILREILELDPTAAGKIAEGKATEEQLLLRILDGAIDALLLEGEGLGVPEEEGA